MKSDFLLWLRMNFDKNPATNILIERTLSPSSTPTKQSSEALKVRKKRNHSLHGNDVDKPLIIVYEANKKKTIFLLFPSSRFFFSFLYLFRAFRQKLSFLPRTEQLFQPAKANEKICYWSEQKNCILTYVLFLLFVFRLSLSSLGTEKRLRAPEETKQLFSRRRIISNGWDGG